MSWPWNELGLPGPAELSEIRRAYAQRLKTTHPEEDPEGFQRLHAAYQEAGRQARRRAAQAEAPSAEPERPPEQEGGAASDWNYEELPEERAFSPKTPEEKPQTPDWDYDALLEEEEAPAGEAGEGAPPAWDFERLFAEGEEEAQEARRRRLEDLRHKNWTRYAPQARQQRELDEEDAWPAVLAAVRALELLERSDAPPAQWRRFLDSSMFLSVRADMDFVFLLEDFLAQRPDLSPEIRRAIFDAYEAQNASKYPAYKPLYRLLGVKRADARRAARAKSGWRNAWRSYPLWRKTVVAVCFTILAVFLSIGVGVNLQTAQAERAAQRAAERWAETAPQWLEEDFGEPFVHAVSGDIFAPAADPERYFRASPYGERSEHWPGYQTNYPHILVGRALEDFAQERELDLDFASYSHETGDAPGAYLFNLPLLGAEEDVAALGALLEDLSRQDWYQVPQINPQSEEAYLVRQPVQYTVFLCHRGLGFYEAPSQEGFDTEEALSLYAQAGPALCRWILEQSGLADKHLGEGTYVLQDREAVELGDGTFFQVHGVDKDTGETEVQYLLSSGGGTLFCVPREKMEGIRSVIDLYRGTPRTLELDTLGLVMVTDQVPGE
ncbi:J domain-containing protein [Oscillibacter sp.]|uniref:J domain-containing protein n=1 Tax=Oscillibacter sp. TaxID=1945593 RepID=UPI002D7FDEEF|nr:J domain-containing protein [Oscillibacter sp.]